MQWALTTISLRRIQPGRAHQSWNDVGISGPSFDQVAVVVEVAECELHPFVPHHSIAEPYVVVVAIE